MTFAAQDSLTPTRPIGLCSRAPRAIRGDREGADGPPVRFRWRRVLQEIAHGEAPKREFRDRMVAQPKNGAN